VLAFLGVSTDYEPPAPFQRAFAGGREQRVREADLTGMLRDIDAAAPDARVAVAAAWVTGRELDAAGREELLRLVGRYLSAPPARLVRERAGLEFTLRKTWNFIPAAPEPIAGEVSQALRTHFAADARRLSVAVGFSAPWLGDASAAACAEERRR